MHRRCVAVLLPIVSVACADPSLSAESRRMSSQEDISLKVAAWNIEWLADQEGQGDVPRTPEDYERLKKYADRLDADIIALAEVEGQVGVSKVFDPAVYDIHIADNDWVQRTGFAYRKGLDITVEPDYYDLSLGGSLRSGAVVRFDAPTVSVRFMAVHLKASCPSGPLDASSDCETLAAQVPILEEWIDEQAEQETPFVVLGDFNRRFFVTADEEIWSEIDDAQPENADLYSPTADVDGDCWGWTDYIDHIVMDRQTTDWYVPGSFVQQRFDSSDSAYEAVLSDHCPISSELLIPGGGGDDSDEDSGDGTSEEGTDSSDGDDASDAGGDSSDGSSSESGEDEDEEEDGDSSEDAGGNDDDPDGPGNETEGGTGDGDESGDAGETNDGGDDPPPGESDGGGSSDGSAEAGADSHGPPPGNGNEIDPQVGCACRQTDHGPSPWGLSAWALLWLLRPRGRASGRRTDDSPSAAQP